MNPALQKTIAFALLIFAGYLLQRKLNGKQDLAGVKVLILSIILPATIFVALLKVEISLNMLLLPILALGLNAALYLFSSWMLPQIGFPANESEWRTMMMLVPSLAPGLSAFPFILEYLGDGPLALAALADVGNKVFVLIILYLIAMGWYYQSHKLDSDNINRRTKLKNLGISLLREPVNLVIILALLMLALGLDFNNLPFFVEDTVARLAGLMTPIVLLFIGMAVRFRLREVAKIIRVLCFRSGLGFLLSAGLIYLGGIGGSNALLAVVFAQCAASFWPFAHMSAIELLRGEGDPPMFDLDLGLNVLAFSLPFSTVIILSVLSVGNWFAAPTMVAPVGLVMLVYPVAYAMRPMFQSGEIEEARA